MLTRNRPVFSSWVFISGFLLGNHYQSSFERSPLVTTFRLWVRGGRLVVIFALANLILGHFSLSCPSGFFTKDCPPWNIFVLGDNSDLTFQILQGIGYVLLAAPMYMSMPRLAALGIAALVAVASAGPYLGYKAVGLTWMLLAGLVGLVLGWVVPAARLRELVTDPRQRLMAAAAGLAGWAVYEAMVIFLGTSRSNVAAYLLGVTGMLLFLYVVNGWISWRGWPAAVMALMARYALLCYLGQMCVLWAWYYLVSDIPVANSFLVSFVLVMTATIGIAAATDWLRVRFRWADQLYRNILG